MFSIKNIKEYIKNTPKNHLIFSIKYNKKELII